MASSSSTSLASSQLVTVDNYNPQTQSVLGKTHEDVKNLIVVYLGFKELRN